MSVDYFLVSRSRRKRVMIGSIGFSGIQSFPGEADVVAFIRWVIDESIDDVVMMNEHQLEALDDEIEFFEV